MKLSHNIKVLVYPTPADLYEAVAQSMLQDVRRQLNTDDSNPRPIVLPTGSTYDRENGIYALFVQKLMDEGIDLTQVPLANMDAYLRRVDGKLQLLDPNDENGYRYYMRENLWRPLGETEIPDSHIFPIPPEDGVVGTPCTAYTNWLKERGNAAVVYGGVGKVPHVAFNVIGSRRSDPARIVQLSEEERQENADLYGLPLDDVEELAATIGEQEIMDADRVKLVIEGERKQEVAHLVLEEKGSPQIPAGDVLQNHKDATLYMDAVAARGVKNRALLTFM